MTILADYFDRYLPLVEADLEAVLYPARESPETFYRMMHYHMGWVDQEGRRVEGDRGKRIRPMITLLVCEAVCGTCEPARPAAAAVELIHNFSLLHDDIEDRSPTRRNRPTVWTLWGEANAINVGDALLALAFLAIPHLSQPGTSQALSSQMLQVVGEVCVKLTHGQYLDMAFESREQVTTEEYLNMIGGKTAALLSGAAHLGALAAGANESVQTHYAAFGENLGMAFQVLDDVLDIWGDPAVTGKEAAIDIRQRKKSLPILYGLARSAELRALYAQPGPLNEAAVSRAVELLDRAGARQYARDLALLYSERTTMHLEAAEPNNVAGKALFELVEQLLNRDR